MSATNELDRTRLAEIENNLRRLFLPGQHFEVRCLAGRAKSQLTGVFDDYVIASVAALTAEIDFGYNVYFGLHPRNKQVTNNLDCGKSDKAKHVAQRRWLLVDVDPIRPADCPSTDAEKTAAKAVLRQVTRYLCGQCHWPTPMIGDSGNGWHLLFRVDLPTDDGGLTERTLQAISAEFTTTSVKIDTVVFDAPRICRLYGTLNHKGEETPERPYRFSKLYPGGGDRAVTPEQLAAVAALAPPAQQSSKSPATRSADNISSKASPPGAEAIAKQVNDVTDDDRPAVDADYIILAAGSWMREQPPAVAGEAGHNQTFKVACGLFRHFGLTGEEAWPILQEYNDTCVPPWSDAE